MSTEERREFNRRCERNKRLRLSKDPEKRRAYIKRLRDWKRANPEKHAASNLKALRKRKLVDPGFKVTRNLRNRLKDIMKSAKLGGTERHTNLTGCTTRQLSAHLESGFTKRMTWENYGTYWHVDHILPCSSFDHSDPKQVAQCWHWTNLRPMRAKDNMAKGAQITAPQMQLLLCVSH